MNQISKDLLKNKFNILEEIRKLKVALKVLSKSI